MVFPTQIVQPCLIVKLPASNLNCPSLSWLADGLSSSNWFAGSQGGRPMACPSHHLHISDEKRSPSPKSQWWNCEFLKPNPVGQHLEKLLKQWSYIAGLHKKWSNCLSEQERSWLPSMYPVYKPSSQVLIYAWNAPLSLGVLMEKLSG